MRLDPKYFNLFLGVCAAVTLVVIIISTIYYASKQQQTFRQEISEADLSKWTMYNYASGDSLTVDQFRGSPVVIHFWSTWSDMSMDLNEILSRLKSEQPDIVVIAASSRDGDEQVIEYMRDHSHDFVYVNGTDLYQGLKVPGVPSQIFVGRDGEIRDHLVGNDPEKMEQKLIRLAEDREI